jgi:hypothetical protein
MIIRHLAFWLDVLNAVLPRRQPRIELAVSATRCSPSGSPTPSVRPGARVPGCVVPFPRAVDGRDAEIAFALSALAEHGDAAKLPRSIVVKH